MTGPDQPDIPPPPTSIAPGDTAAFETFFLRLLKPICRYIYRYVGSQELAEELAHDAFLQIWRRLSTTEPVRDLESYVYAAARNNAINHLRRQAVEARHLQQHLQPEALAEGDAAPAEGDERLVSGELAAAIQRAVDALPERQRQVILLKWKSQASHLEIGTALGIDPDTVSVHFRRAIEKLRKTLPPLLP
jgi:RNA polymerase sigma-70 factor (family 1)